MTGVSEAVDPRYPHTRIPDAPSGSQLADPYFPTAGLPSFAVARSHFTSLRTIHSQNAHSHKMSTTRKPIVTRSSLACLRCRTRHQKCDAKKPRCSRCIDSAGLCEYAKSRRGGGSVDNRELGSKNVTGYLAEIGDEQVMSNLQTPSAMLDGVSFATPSSPQRLRIPPTPLSDGSSRTRRSSQTLRNNTLIDAYYNNLHKFHPIIFPRARLLSLNQDPAWQPRLVPLMAVLRLIGNIYISQEWSSSLHDTVEAFISQGSGVDPIMVQARLLYSVALFWQERKAPAMREIAAAAEIAMELKMFNREFAEDNAAGDAVVAESWRRTWWMLYILDGFYAGTLGTLEYNVMHIEATVDLPCEEYEYESEVSKQMRDVWWEHANLVPSGYSEAKDVE